MHCILCLGRFAHSETSVLTHRLRPVLDVAQGEAHIGTTGPQTINQLSRVTSSRALWMSSRSSISSLRECVVAGTTASTITWVPHRSRIRKTALSGEGVTHFFSHIRTFDNYRVPFTSVISLANLLRRIFSVLMRDRPLLSVRALTPTPRLARQPRQAMPLRANCCADKNVVSGIRFLFVSALVCSEYITCYDSVLGPSSSPVSFRSVPHTRVSTHILNLLHPYTSTRAL